MASRDARRQPRAADAAAGRASLPTLLVMLGRRFLLFSLPLRFCCCFSIFREYLRLGFDCCDERFCSGCCCFG